MTRFRYGRLLEEGVYDSIYGEVPYKTYELIPIEIQPQLGLDGGESGRTLIAECNDDSRSTSQALHAAASQSGQNTDHLYLPQKEEKFPSLPKLCPSPLPEVDTQRIYPEGPRPSALLNL